MDKLIFDPEVTIDVFLGVDPDTGEVLFDLNKIVTRKIHLRRPQAKNFQRKNQEKYMRGTKMNCPKCGYKINPGAAMVKLRNKALSPERRKEIAIKAARVRWDRAGSRKSV